MGAADMENSAIVDRPAHVAPERLVDFDIYQPLREGEDFHHSWKALQDSGVPDVIWTPRNGGHWLVLRGKLVSQVLSDYANFSNHTVLVPKDTAGEAYRLDEGDQMHVVVYGDSQLTGDYTVDSEGFISLPLAGRLQARGSTAPELEQTIKNRLSEGLLVNPSVNVQIRSMRPFFILGEVKQPGQYVAADNLTVLAAVAAAGGFTYRAVTDEVTITRRLGDKTVKGRADTDARVQPGDVIYIYERYF